MSKIAIALLTAVTLVQPALSVADGKTTGSCAKPNSFVPHPHTTHHVYGAPIQPAIARHPRASQHKQAPKKKRTWSIAMRSSN